MEDVYFWMSLYTGGASSADNIIDCCIVGTLLGPCGVVLLSTVWDLL